MFEKLGKISNNNLQIIKNMLGAFLIKGVALIISFVQFPLYIRFFNDQATLGLWYTMLSVLNWVNLFDLGLGHGLRNKLPGVIEKKDTTQITSLISTTYGFMICLASVVLVIGEVGISQLNWNKIFNVEISIISNDVLVKCMQIVFLGVIVSVVLKIITSILYALQYSAIVNLLTLIPNIIILFFLWIAPSGSLERNLKTMSIINICAINLPYIICTWLVFKYLLKDNIPAVNFIKKKCIRDIFSIGISVLWLQIVFMVVSSTNELIISTLTTSNYVVEYQVYNKVFKTAGMVISLSLTPIWSAVTKAKAQSNFRWIRKIYILFLAATFICALLELCVIPILPWLIDVWLGRDAIEINLFYALIFVFSSTMAVLHSVNTAIGNGLSYFKVQMIWMTFAALIFIPLSYALVHRMGGWIGVVIANTLSLMPYEFFAPFFTMKMLDKQAAKE